MPEFRWCADMDMLLGVMRRLRGVTDMDIPGADMWAEATRHVGR